MASGRKRRVQAIDASVDVDVSQLMKSTKRAVGKRSKLAGNEPLCLICGLVETIIAE